MLKEIVNDLAAEIAAEVASQYSRKNWVTHDELADLKRVLESVSKSKILDAFSPFYEHTKEP